MNGEVFKRRREELGLTQAELAERLLITQPRLAQIEADYKEPSVAVVRQAAEIFGCSADELVFGRARG